MTKCFEKIVTRTSMFYKIYEQEEKHPTIYNLVDITSDEKQIKGLPETFKANSIIAALRTGGEAIFIAGSEFVLNSERIKSAAIIAAASFK